METLKGKIKNLSERQTFLKNQRKTVNLVGEKKMEPWLATMEHQQGRESLRLLYAAYGLMRGKKFSVTENHHPEENHPLYAYKLEIDEIISRYEEVICTSE